MLDLGTEDVIDSRIGVHDINQFEVKLDYAIDPARRTNRYRVDTFFFLPYSLGVGPLTYGREQFYADVQAYIRFKTPSIALQRLLDPNSEVSPFAKIDRLAPKLAAQPADSQLVAKVEHELLLLGCLIRSNLRDGLAGIVAELPTGRDVSGLCAALAAGIDQVMTRLRLICQRAHNERWPVQLLETVDLTDEYVSVICEMQFTTLVAAIDVALARGGSPVPARAVMTARIVAERLHRRAAGYPAILHDEGDNEHFVYRRGYLKKVVMSVLFLKIRRAAEGKTAADLAGAAAAALAMLVATAAAIVAQARYGLNTLPFIVALVASYVVKDRVKEWLRQYLAGKMAPLIADYAVDIRDPADDAAIGNCRETFTWLQPAQVPTDVWQRRHAGAGGAIEIRTKAELVMHYRKVIELRSDIIGGRHRRLHDINDIIRFDVSRFLARADDGLQPVSRYLPDEDRVVELKLPKVYHLNLVFVLTAMDRKNAEQIQRVRVVFDKAGIKRVEMPGPTPAA